MNREIHVTIRMSPTMVQAMILVISMILFPLQLASESMTLATTYPSPAGVYSQVTAVGALGSSGTGWTTANYGVGLALNVNSAIDFASARQPGGSLRYGMVQNGDNLYIFSTNANDTGDNSQPANFALQIQVGNNVLIGGGANQLYRCNTGAATNPGVLVATSANADTVCGVGAWTALPLFIP